MKGCANMSEVLTINEIASPALHPSPPILSKSLKSFCPRQKLRLSGVISKTIHIIRTCFQISIPELGTDIPQPRAFPTTLATIQCPALRIAIPIALSRQMALFLPHAKPSHLESRSLASLEPFHHPPLIPTIFIPIPNPMTSSPMT
jgi:hypothetical protein